MLDITKPHVTALATSIKTEYPDIGLIVLSPAPSKARSNQIKKFTQNSWIDQLFYWQGNPYLFLAMVKLYEDRLNIDHDTQAAPLEVILLVEDSVRFYSSFLPSIYTTLIRQNRSSLQEGLNQWGKNLRMRARPKILLAQSYEEALELYYKYENHILGIISDVSYNKDQYPDGRAGLKLTQVLKKRNPDLPFLIQSTDPDVEEEARSMGAEFLWKLSPHLLDDLDRYMLLTYGFGPFIFRDPVSKKALARAQNIKELQEKILDIPEDCFVQHVKHNDFSRWLKARSLFNLSEKLRIINLDGLESSKEIRNEIFQTIKSYRDKRNRGVIAEFSKMNFDESSFFCRLGSGSLGGKGRGLAFLDAQIKGSGFETKFPDVEISIPKTIVLATDLFASFMEQNHLYKFPFSTLSDSEILDLYQACPLSAGTEANLRTALKIMTKPLAVRSSSLFLSAFCRSLRNLYGKEYRRY